MIIRFKILSENQNQSILQNSNFLNSQNYLISDFKKKYFINNFLILKYFSIINNRIIWTVLFSILIWIVAFIYPNFFHYLFIIILSLIWILIPFWIFAFFAYLFLKGKVYNNKNFWEKLNIFEISSPILSFKNILIEEKNQKLNLFKKIISFFIIFFLSILFSIIFF